jgi:hypothetical protein
VILFALSVNVRTEGRMFISLIVIAVRDWLFSQARARMWGNVGCMRRSRFAAARGEARLPAFLLQKQEDTEGGYSEWPLAGLGQRSARKRVSSVIARSGQAPLRRPVGSQ